MLYLEDYVECKVFYAYFYGNILAVNDCCESFYPIKTRLKSIKPSIVCSVAFVI